MKKILLSISLIAAAATPAAAQAFSEYFTVKYDGKEYSDGETIYINKYEDFIPGVSVSFVDQYIQVLNKGDEPRAIQGQLAFGTTPTKEEYNANTAFWGNASLCHTKTYDAPAGCLPAGINDLGNGIVLVPAAGAPAADIFNWDPHVMNCSAEADATYRLIMNAMALKDPEDDGDYEVESERCTIYLNFSTNANAAVSDINLDSNAPAEYYNLQGIRVLNPSKGVFIKRQGSSTTKVNIQ